MLQREQFEETVKEQMEAYETEYKRLEEAQASTVDNQQKLIAELRRQLDHKAALSATVLEENAVHLEMSVAHHMNRTAKMAKAHEEVHLTWPHVYSNTRCIHLAAHAHPISPTGNQSNS